MTLIKCNECGKKISGRINKCIHCGTSNEPFEKEKLNENREVVRNTDKKFNKILGVIILGGVIVGIIIYFVSNIFNNSDNDSSSKVESKYFNAPLASCPSTTLKQGLENFTIDGISKGILNQVWIESGTNAAGNAADFIYWGDLTTRILLNEKNQVVIDGQEDGGLGKFLNVTTNRMSDIRIDTFVTFLCYQNNTPNNNVDNSEENEESDNSSSDDNNYINNDSDTNNNSNNSPNSSNNDNINNNKKTNDNLASDEIWSEWSEWNTSKITANATTEVETRKVETKTYKIIYKYKHYVCPNPSYLAQQGNSTPYDDGCADGYWESIESEYAFYFGTGYGTCNYYYGGYYDYKKYDGPYTKETCWFDDGTRNGEEQIEYITEYRYRYKMS